jgi:hypothetical protein
LDKRVVHPRSWRLIPSHAMLLEVVYKMGSGELQRHFERPVRGLACEGDGVGDPPFL